MYNDKNKNNNDSKNDRHGNLNLPKDIKGKYPTVVQCYRSRITDHIGDPKNPICCVCFQA